MSCIGVPRHRMLLCSAPVQEALGACWTKSVALSGLICRALGTQIRSKGILIYRTRRGIILGLFLLSVVPQYLSQCAWAVLCRCSFQGVLREISSNCYQLESRRECVSGGCFIIAISCHLREFIHLFPLKKKTVFLAGAYPTCANFLGEGGRDKLFSLCCFLLPQGIIWGHYFALSCCSGPLWGWSSFSRRVLQ